MMKNKNVGSLIILLIISFSIKAQYNSLNLYNPHFTFNKAELLPSKLGENRAKVEFRILPNFYLYSGNTFMPIDDILYPNEQRINDAVDKSEGSSLFGGGAEVPLLAFSYKVKKGDNEFLTFSLSGKSRVLTQIGIDANFLKLLWNGNKQFEGKEVNLGNIAISSFATTEISLGISKPLKIKGINSRIGANFKYLLASGGVYLPKNNATMTTGVDGRFIKFNNLDYKLQTSYAENGNNFTGKGVALDLSVSMKVAGGLNVSVGVLDIGNLTFSENTRSYEAEADFTFEGLVLNTLFDNYDVDPDSLFEGEFKTIEDSNQTFSMPLPSRFIMHVEKNITNEKGYVKHGVYLTYIQGFSNVSGSTTRPYFSAGYSYSLKNIVNVGPTINYGGYGGFGLGMFLSLKAGPFRLGVGTNAGLTYLIAPGSAKNADLSFMTTWSIGKQTQKKSASFK